MKRKSDFQVQETIEELKELLKKTKNKKQLEKIQALYWFQTGQFKTVVEIAQALGKNRSTIHRWLNQYNQYGLDFLGKILEKTRKKAIISDQVQEKLIQEFLLTNQKINYKNIQKWLEENFNIKASYSVVYKTVKALSKNIKKSPNLKNKN